MNRPPLTPPHDAFAVDSGNRTIYLATEVKLITGMLAHHRLTMKRFEINPFNATSNAPVEESLGAEVRQQHLQPRWYVVRFDDTVVTTFATRRAAVQHAAELNAKTGETYAVARAVLAIARHPQGTLHFLWPEERIDDQPIDEEPTGDQPSVAVS